MNPENETAAITMTATAMTETIVSEIATDMARRGLMAAPVLIAIAAIWQGSDGAASAAFALGIVLINLVGSARSLDWAARISPTAMAMAALGGYVFRLAFVTVAVLAVKDLPWVDLVTLGIVLIVAHLGLLTWELRSISLSLAAPGLRPVRATNLAKGV